MNERTAPPPTPAPERPNRIEALRKLVQPAPSLSPVRGRDREFLPAALEILETPPAPLPVALMLTILTLLAIYRPELPRRGVLGFPTTRGDRFFVAMLCAAFVHILWIRFGGGALWYPLGASLLLGVAIFRFV